MITSMTEINVAYAKGVFDDLTQPDEFMEWAKDNVHIIREFQRLAWQLHAVGKRKHYGAKTLVEKMRWDSHFRENDPGTYKLNNNYVSGMSRAVMYCNPTLEGMFRVRS